MTDTNTQAAVDAPVTTAEPVVEGNNAQAPADDLDTLLSQYEAQTKVAQPSPPPTTQTPNTPPLDPDRLKRVEERLFREDVSNAVSNIRGDLKVDPEIVESWLDAAARKDMRVANAFLQKDVNPQQWKQIEAGLAKRFAEKVKSMTYDQPVTEDRNAVAAAVRGASTKAPAESAPNYSSMTNGCLLYTSPSPRD